MEAEEQGLILVLLRLKGHTITLKERFHSWGLLPLVSVLLFASYKVAYQVAKMKKPHTIVETLIKPCALKIVKIELSVEARKNCNEFLCQTMLSGV